MPLHHGHGQSRNENRFHLEGAMEYASKDIELKLSKMARGARIAKILLRTLALLVILIWAVLAFIVGTHMTTVVTYNVSATSVAFSFMQWVAVAVTLWVLSDIFGEVARRRSPFSDKTVRKLLIAGFIMIAAIAANVLSPAWSVSTVNASGGYFSFTQEGNVVLNFDLGTALAALVAVFMFGMSALFRYGAMLQSVSDDTV